MGRVKLGWSLTKKSWSVLRNDGSLALFPVISGLATVALFLLLWAPALGLGWVDIASSSSSSGESMNPFGWVLLGVTVYLTTVVAVFCNVALAGCVALSLKGQDTSLRTGFSVAASRLSSILAWAFIATVVSMVIRAVQERLGVLGAILGAIGGVAWNLATLFVVPVLALEGLGPVAALKRSAETFRARWGEGLTGNALIGLVTMLVIIAILAVGVAGGLLLSPLGAGAVIPWVGVCLLAILVTAAVMAALNQVFNTALYIYSRDGQVEGPFSTEEFSAAFRPKR